MSLRYRVKGRLGEPSGSYPWNVKQGNLARQLAREARLPAAKAQDRVEELVHRIVTKLRQGRTVELPGLGKLVTGSRQRKKA
jgi:nucleoid DNA-binding protein